MDLKVNLNTVSKAYKELEIREVLTTQQGSGTFINQVDSVLLKKERDMKLKDICTQFSMLASAYGFTTKEIIAYLSKNEILNNNNHDE